MYQSILTRRYLYRKAVPQLAMLSVALCTAMVIIVFSVMNGFLDQVRSSMREQVGDVQIDAGIRGMAHYEELLERIRALPATAAATPVIETLGLLKFDEDAGGKIEPVRLVGIEPEGYDAVTGYAEGMYWRHIDDPDELARIDPADDRHPAVYGQGVDEETRRLVERRLEEMEREGQRLEEDGEPAAVVGVEINPHNRRLGYGSFRTSMLLPTREVTVSAFPLDREGGLVGTESRRFPVANEFWVGRFDIDSQYVFLPFDTLQRMLKMQPAQQRTEMPVLDEEGQPVLDEFGEVVFRMEPRPGRASKVLVRAAEGVDPLDLRDEVEGLYFEFAERYGPEAFPSFATVKTWEQLIARYLAVIQKEIALLMSLFVIISLVAVFLILAIFWTIVQQKTRDIGILLAVGASRPGIAGLFLGYGLALGVVGALLGGAIAHVVVWNINPIHEFVGRVTGALIWDPEVYYFSEVPDEVATGAAVIVMACGALFAVLGAALPAVWASRVDPVRALRYE